MMLTVKIRAIQEFLTQPSKSCRRLAAETARCDERVKEAERIGAERLQEATRRQSVESAGLRERVLDAERALRDAGGHKDELERVTKPSDAIQTNLDPESYILDRALYISLPSLRNLNPRC